MILPIWHI